jgi:XTP/dITP diphosphohydrolase
MKLLIATHNRGKLDEYRRIFASLPLEIVSLGDVEISWDAGETGDTFEANARLKAKTYCAATQLATLADDSGLEVDALGGRPGVYSARYGGPNLSPQQRYELVLAQMRAVPPELRTARFICVIALAMPGNPVRTVAGECSGAIAAEPRGTGGFGYDPIFWLPQYNCTMAELPAETKDSISHRAKAAEKAEGLLRQAVQSA